MTFEEWTREKKARDYEETESGEIRRIQGNLTQWPQNADTAGGKCL